MLETLASSDHPRGTNAFSDHFCPGGVSETSAIRPAGDDRRAGAFWIFALAREGRTGSTPLRSLMTTALLLGRGHKKRAAPHLRERPASLCAPAAGAAGASRAAGWRSKTARGPEVPRFRGIAEAKRTSLREPPGSRESGVHQGLAASRGSDGRQAGGTQTRARRSRPSRCGRREPRGVRRPPRSCRRSRRSRG